jgi:hypothetical protein
LFLLLLPLLLLPQDAPTHEALRRSPLPPFALFYRLDHGALPLLLGAAADLTAHWRLRYESITGARHEE